MSDAHDLDLAHRSCGLHREELEASERCGCFYCRSIFPSAEVAEWCDDDQTALCPRCGIDAVIGSASGWPITEEFMAKMHRRWFGR